MEETPVGEVKMEPVETSEVAPPVFQGKDQFCGDPVPQLPPPGGLAGSQDNQSSASEISSIDDIFWPKSDASPTDKSPGDLSGLKWEELHDRARKLGPPFRKRATRD